MTLFLRFSLLYFVILVLGIGWAANVFYKDVEPSIKRATEESMVDTANLLAELIAPMLEARKIQTNMLQDAVAQYNLRQPNAEIWSHIKDRTNMAFYITNTAGEVQFHSSKPEEVGKDYSAWRDVSRTLKGEYGARTTPYNPDDKNTAEMYVAAPIFRNGDLIGVLTVIQAVEDLMPVIKSAEHKVLFIGVSLIVLLLIIGLIMATVINKVTRRLTDYCDEVSKGANPPQLTFFDKSFDQLAKSMHQMRQELDGKDYVEQYVHTLTHELKTPLAAISSSAQILHNPIEEKDKQRFIHNIDCEVERMKNLVDRVLLLATVENFELEDKADVDLLTLLDEETQSLEALASSKQLRFSVHTAGEEGKLQVSGDKLMLALAVRNLLINALDFANAESAITITVAHDEHYAVVQVSNNGPHIPEYALNRLFDRFFSEPRPSTQRKSTGLGLVITQEIAKLHGGDIRLHNHDSGVTATLRLTRK